MLTYFKYSETSPSGLIVIHKNGTIYLGLHNTPKAAAEVARIKRMELKGEFHRDN